MASGSRRRAPDDEDESYFVSLSDLMAGVLFLFIIMLAYFGLKLSRTTQEVSSGRARPAERIVFKPPPKPVAAANPQAGGAPPDLRTLLLEQVQSRLDSAGVKGVQVDVAGGVIRVPSAILFGGGAQPTATGQHDLAVIADALTQVLPCGASSQTLPAPATCPSVKGRVGAVLIEGFNQGNDPWAVSTAQASSAFHVLVTAQPGLQTLRSDPSGAGPSILSIAGYGPSRPLGGSAEANNRLEIAILMAAP